MYLLLKTNPFHNNTHVTYLSWQVFIKFYILINRIARVMGYIYSDYFECVKMFELKNESMQYYDVQNYICHFHFILFFYNVMVLLQLIKMFHFEMFLFWTFITLYPVSIKIKILISEAHIYHTTKTIFGKDQRMPATGYILYPTLSASLTHCIWQWVRIFMLMHAYHHAFSPHALTRSYIFRTTETGLNKLFCLFLCLPSACFVGSKSSHFAV